MFTGVRAQPFSYPRTTSFVLRQYGTKVSIQTGGSGVAQTSQNYLDNAIRVRRDDCVRRQWQGACTARLNKAELRHTLVFDRKNIFNPKLHS